jgi:hypothetical protein
MGKLSSGSLSFFLKLQCAPAREERSHVTSDFFLYKKNWIFYFAKFCSNLCLFSNKWSLLQNQKKEKNKRRKPGRKKALLVMLRVLERPILQGTNQIETHVLCSSLSNQCLPWVARLPQKNTHTHFQGIWIDFRDITMWKLAS